MKKGLSIAILLCYLLSLVGFNVVKHECAGETSIIFFGIGSSNCECEHESDAHDEDCCHDEQLLVKALDSDKVGSKSVAIGKIESKKVFADFVTACKIDFDFNSLVKEVIKYEYPPRYSPPIYLQNRVFLI